MSIGVEGDWKLVVGSMVEETEVAVVGAGPGGYVAALRLGQLGKQVVLIDKKGLGGICLHQGCIPSKSLIHAAEFAFDSKHLENMGIRADKMRVDVAKLMAWKNGGIEKLENGIRALCKKRDVEVIEGRAAFENNSRVRVESEHEVREIEFQRAVIDTGSKPIPLAANPWSEIVISSDRALELDAIPRELIVIGAGYIGVELGTVFAKLGSTVSIIQRSDRILSNLDEEAALVVQNRLQELGVHVFLNAQVAQIREAGNGALVQVQSREGLQELKADKVLVAMGRKPNTEGLGLENLKKLQFDENGYVRVNEQCQTAEPTIFAIGDITGPPLLAHRAFAMGKVAAQAIAGKAVAFDNRAVPAVIFSDPEVASVGWTEKEAQQKGFKTKVGKFPFRALGRAVSIDKTRGFVKVIVDADSQLILGIQIVGENASDMIGEAALAIELGAQAEDLADTIHPHPTFSEALMEAAEDALGKSVHQ